MFYSNSNLSFLKKDESGTEHGLDSYHLSGQVFTGNHWDDFNLGAQLGTYSKKILVLGLGNGACIRALLCSDATASITLVDSDPASVTNTQRIFATNFPQLLNRLTFVCSDAQNYLSHAQLFDLICVDLYTSKGYADCLNGNEFYELLNQSLSEKGCVLFNTFTTPSHFELATLSTAALVTIARLKQYFSQLHYLPYRRNLTFIASQREITYLQPVCAFNKLSLGDQLIVELNRLRLEFAFIANHATGRVSLFPTFEEISREMNEKWQSFRIFDNLNTQEIKSISFSAEKLLSLVTAAPAEPALAVLFGAWVQDGDQDFSSFIESVCNLDCTLCSEQTFIHFHLTQACAIAVHPSGRYTRYIARLRLIVERLRTP